MNISFDLDGVLYPFTKVCYDYLQIHHGIKEDYDTFWKKTWRSYSELHRENIVGIRSLYEKVPINPTVKSRLDYLATYNQIFYIKSFYLLFWKTESSLFLVFWSISKCFLLEYSLGKVWWVFLSIKFIRFWA